ncbi:putative endoribonuclease L-PSP [Desulfovibrio sp. A2]|nr:putative endoribonuclease L-PSP [Desulfovibrio sp. A2]
MKHQISSPDAPAAIGPYSQAIRTGNLLFVSGQLPVNPGTGAVVEGDAKAQAAQSCANLAAILAEAGASLASVVKTTVFITDMAHFPLVNEAYAAAFAAPCPARSCVAVRALPLGCLVEIEAVAAL